MIVTRVLATIPYTSTTRACCTSSRTSLHGWLWQAQQVVDGLPEEALHEQELGIVEDAPDGPCNLTTGRNVI